MIVATTPTLGVTTVRKNLIEPFVLHGPDGTFTMPLVTKITGFARTYDRTAVQQSGGTTLNIIGTGVPDLTSPITFTVSLNGMREADIPIVGAYLQQFCETATHISRDGWYWRVTQLHNGLDEWGASRYKSTFDIQFLRHYEFATRGKVSSLSAYTAALKGRFIGYRAGDLLVSPISSSTADVDSNIPSIRFSDVYSADPTRHVVGTTQTYYFYGYNLTSAPVVSGVSGTSISVTNSPGAGTLYAVETPISSTGAHTLTLTSGDVTESITITGVPAYTGETVAFTQQAYYTQAGIRWARVAYELGNTADRAFEARHRLVVATGTQDWSDWQTVAGGGLGFDPTLVGVPVGFRLQVQRRELGGTNIRTSSFTPTPEVTISPAPPFVKTTEPDFNIFFTGDASGSPEWTFSVTGGHFGSSSGVNKQGSLQIYSSKPVGEYTVTATLTTIINGSRGVLFQQTYPLTVEASSGGSGGSQAWLTAGGDAWTDENDEPFTL